MPVRNILILLAALHGLTGVVFAAIGAHAGSGSVVTTAATMELIHAVAALAVLAALPGRLGEASALAFLAGSLLFAGGLYSSGLWHTSLGPIAPIGGLLLIAGWILLAYAAIREGKEKA
jgi:uncharacterized membrane protein YgdD (TMEM256/DUF423 family)